MKIGLFELKSKSAQLFSMRSLIPALTGAGADVTHHLMVNDDHKGIVNAIDYLFNTVQCLLLYGDSATIKNALSELTGMQPENIAQIMIIADRDILLIPANADADYVNTVIVPAISVKSRTMYSSEVFRTFGLSESQLKDLLKDQIKNRNKIGVTIEGELLDYAVTVRYSNKMGKITVDEFIAAITEKLKPYIYSVDALTLYDKTAELLKIRKKKLAVAESFTGGNILSKLISYDGASAFLAEGLVPYSDDAKVRRLNVGAELIRTSTAVNGDVAYEMAAGLLTETGADIVLATTGYAGSAPTGKNGLCYIAVGDSDGIHVYEHVFAGTRLEVIEYGTQAAFYYLMKLLSGEPNPFIP